MGLNILSIHGVLCNAVLVNAHECKYFESALVDFVASVRNDTHDDLLPASGAPSVRTRPGAQVANILDDSVHSFAKQNFIFVVPVDQLSKETNSK
jgi:hypothetical protein